MRVSFLLSHSHTHTHPSCWGTAASLGQQSTGSFILIILRLQLDSSQPDLFTVWVSLERKIRRRGTEIECEGQRGRNRKGENRVRHRHAWILEQVKVCITSSSPGRPERGYFWLQAHPQPATWTWPPLATGPLPWDSEPRPFGAGLPKTP